MRTTVLALVIMSALALQTAAQALIAADDSTSQLSYDCRLRDSRLDDPGGIRIVKDYSLRLARTDHAERRTARLREIMRLYRARDWSSLERVVIDQACSEHVIPPQRVPFPSPGSHSPEFRLLRVDDRTPLTLAKFRGQSVVVVFWATWCVPCIAELPDLAELADRHGDRVTVLAIAYEDSVDRIQDWLDRNPPGSVIHLLDPQGTAASAFAVFAVPATFVIDEEGRVQVSPTNPFNRMTLAEFVQSLGAGNT